MGELGQLPRDVVKERSHCTVEVEATFAQVCYQLYTSVAVHLLKTNSIEFPPLEEAEPDGLLAVGGDLRPPRLLSAYAQGIFPWYSDGLPILWHSPDPRFVLEPEKLHLPRSL